MRSLGATLKRTRESLSLTLRQIEDATGISNAYLSQLENDKIKKPSANILYKLADIYKIELNILLQAAGIIKKSALKQNDKGNEWVNRIAFYAENLDEVAKKEVLSYIAFMAQKKNA